MSGQHEVNHGNSVAAWTSVTIVMIASCVGAVGVLIAAPWVFWLGVALMAVGVATGKVLQMMGFGIKRESTEA
jgi:hypothetical protein